MIVDYGVGNLGSIRNMFKKAGVPTIASSDHETILNASRLVLPGVGAFDTAVKQIDKLGLRSVLEKKVLDEKVPLLGICLGMQLLMEGSEEGSLPGFGWINGYVRSFRNALDSDFKIPHMGWNEVISARDSSLIKDLNKARFYFVHSFFVDCSRKEDVVLTVKYGIEFPAAIHRENIYGVQFHPEKSHRFGMQLLRNFSGL